jgi:hypothetical protein
MTAPQRTPACGTRRGPVSGRAEGSPRGDHTTGRDHAPWQWRMPGAEGSLPP